MIRFAKLLTAGLLLGAFASPLWAQPIPTQAVHTNKTRFRIPFRYDAVEMRQLGATEIRLYRSADRGNSWEHVQTVAPDAAKFQFEAPTDGEYWFIVRTLDSKNRLHPDPSVVEPGLKVIVDTARPELNLSLRAAGPGRAILKWVAGDDHLDLTQLRLEYSQTGSNGWTAIGVVPTAEGETEWYVPRGGKVSVRGSIADQARNQTTAEKDVNVSPPDAAVPRARSPESRQPTAESTGDRSREMASSMPSMFSPAIQAPLQPRETPRTTAPTSDDRRDPQREDAPWDDTNDSSEPKSEFNSTPHLAMRDGRLAGPVLGFNDPSSEPGDSISNDSAPGQFDSDSEAQPGIDRPIASNDPWSGNSTRNQNPSKPRLKGRNTASNEKPLIKGSTGPAAVKLTSTPATGLPERRPTASAGTSTTRRKVVNRNRFNLSYRVQEMGPSGLGAVQIYITNNGGANWFHYGSDDDLVSPAIVELTEEGTYGFAIGAASGAGLSTDPPQPGDTPTMTVTLDKTLPELELLPPEQGRGKNAGKLLLQWKYRDANPAETAVRFSISTGENEPWQPVTDWVTNSGEYVWTIPNGMTNRFMLRAEARDLAGNVRTVESPGALVIDLARPVADILDIEAADAPESTDDGQ